MCMWDGYEDSPSVYRSKIQRTRKERKCGECNRKIAIGEPYQNVFMVYDGAPRTFVMCQHCLVAATWLVENCGGYLLEGVWEDVHSHVSELHRPQYRAVYRGLRRLEVGRERQWQRFDQTGLMALPKLPPVVDEKMAA